MLQHGWNTTCYQILNPGISLWFSSESEAVIGYVECSRARVVAGAPVCSESNLPGVVDEFEAESSSKGLEVCYFGAEERLGALLTGQEGYSAVVLGAQPVWHPENFLNNLQSARSLRYQLHRAANKGVRVVEWEVERAAQDKNLNRCLQQWLQSRGLPPLHFLVEPQTLSRLMDRRIFVAEISHMPVAFVVLTPVPSRQGWVTEQFVRGADAPNGTVELMLAKAIDQVCANGSDFMTMGIVPLSNHGSAAGKSNPAWLNTLLKWIRAHGRRFYNFDGLDQFKSKFQPDGWQPIYAITNRKRFSPKTLYAVAGAFSVGPPSLLLAHGLGRAVRQELHFLGTIMRLQTHNGP